MKTSKLIVGAVGAAIGVVALVVVSALPASAFDNAVTYTGQGLISGDGGLELEEELCGVENGAPVDGPYLQWVLTATRSDNADITGPWGTEDMIKRGGGAFHFISDFVDLDTLPGNVTATYDGTARNVQLVISHGCPGDSSSS
jgi:hypothetical protein